jgi:acetylornithine deacetylase/succinyl-diaminopimelate desuccinylase-like protein
MAVAFKMAAESNVRLTGDLVFAATADEEAGSRYGMGWLVQHRPDLVLTDYALTESGGGITVGDHHQQRITITTGQKGAAGRRIRLRGASGHGSMPYGLTGGVHLAADAIDRITKHRTNPVIPTEPWWRNLVTALGFDHELVSRLLDPATLDDALAETGELARVLHALTHLTISPNVVMSGTKANVIPGEAIIDLDIRLLAGQTAEDAERELSEILSGLPGEVLIEPGYEALAVETAQNDDLYRVLCEVIGEFVPGAEPLPMLTPGGNDARHYLVRGLPCYGFGMFSPEMDIASFRARFHGDNERIDVASVRIAAAAYLRIVHRLLACHRP